MTLLERFYPQHRLPTGEWCPDCTASINLVVCLPPGAGPQLLIDRLRPYVAASTVMLDARHFVLWRHPDPTEARLLVRLDTDPARPGVEWCAGGPIGLLDLAGIVERARACFRPDLAEWQSIVAGTKPARPWSHYLDIHQADPGRYPAARAIADFEAQPRIAAMVAAPAIDSVERYAPDMYGPGLEALHSGNAGIYADYLAGMLTFGDGLVTLDGQLLVPSFSPVLVEQTLAERQLFHDRARGYIAALAPTALLVAVTYPS